MKNFYKNAFISLLIFAAVVLVGQSVSARIFNPADTTNISGFLVDNADDATTGALTVESGGTGTAGSPSLSFGDGDTGLYESVDDVFRFTIGGINTMYIDTTEFRVAKNFGASLAYTDTTATVPAFTFQGDSDTGIGRAGTDAMSLITGGTSRLYIDSSGQVGVATTTPQARLHVGNVLPPSWIFDGATEDGLIVGDTTDIDGRIYVEGSQSAGYFMYDSGGTADERIFSFQINGGTSKFRSYNDSGTQNSMFMEFNHNTDAIALSPNGDGKVGVATSTPQRDLSVEGSVYSDECDLADGATVTMDLANCNQGRVTLTANRIIALSNETDAEGQTIRLVICQDGSGSHTITSWDSNIRWAGGSAPTLTTTANKCDVIAGFVTGATSTPVVLLDSVLDF